VRPKPRSSDARGDQCGAPRKGDIPSRGVSHLPEQAEGHVLSVPLRTAEWELGERRYEGVCRQGPRSDDQLGVTLEHLSSAVSKKALAVKKAIVGKKAAATKRGSKCAAKHADPKTGKTWSGFGRAPGWIAGAKNRSAFLVDKSGVESPEATVKAHVAKKKPAAKKASAKKVAKPAAKKAAGVAKAVATPAPAKTTSLPPGGASQLDLARNLR